MSWMRTDLIGNILHTAPSVVDKEVVRINHGEHIDAFLLERGTIFDERWDMVAVTGPL